MNERRRRRGWHHHGQPVRLGDDAACRADARPARHRATRRASSRPIARPSGSTTMPRGAQTRGLKLIIAGAGGAAHLPGMAAALTPLAGARRAGREPHAAGHRQPAFDRADAGRRPGRDPCDRPGRRRQCGACSRRRSWPWRSGNRRAALDSWRRAQTDAVAEQPELARDASRRARRSAFWAAASSAG